MQKRNWDVLIIGGASGSGKTSVSLPLARYYGVDLVRVDDFQVLLKALTTYEVLPDLHFEITHPNFKEYGADETLDLLIKISRSINSGLKAVIDDHILENIPMVLEGDFILPELAASYDNPRIKTIFIHEPSREQILQNFLEREGTLQHSRTDGSYAYGNWLKESCSEFGISVVESRPWDTLMERVISAIQ
ncbi:MAG: hypothetical protein FWC96_03710 [Oscillospiraceae bacterium]|nr:hypothetical protein [Oscillospiraceae bacterium]